MASERGRSVLWMIWNNFKRSILRPPRKGRLVGMDENGTKYFEIPAEPQRGKRHPTRWYETRIKDDFELPLPAEWEAWLRGRRSDPPTQEELLKNMAIQRMKKENALKSNLSEESHDSKKASSDFQTSQKRPFPKYDEYEREPGKPPQKDSEDR